MIIFRRNENEIPIEFTFSEISTGTIKTNIESATVRIYSILNGNEVVHLPETDLVQVGTTNKFRYIWGPEQISEGSYSCDLSASDTNGIDHFSTHQIFISPREPYVDMIDNNQRIMYDSGDREYARYNLYDIEGNPTNLEVARKTKV